MCENRYNDVGVFVIGKARGESIACSLRLTSNAAEGKGTSPTDPIIILILTHKWSIYRLELANPS